MKQEPHVSDDSAAEPLIHPLLLRWGALWFPFQMGLLVLVLIDVLLTNSLLLADVAFQSFLFWRLVKINFYYLLGAVADSLAWRFGLSSRGLTVLLVTILFCVSFVSLAVGIMTFEFRRMSRESESARSAVVLRTSDDALTWRKSHRCWS